MPQAPPARASTTTIVVRFHSSVPSDSGRSVGIVYAPTSMRSIAPAAKVLLAGSISDRGDQRIFSLPGIEPRVLHDDRHIRFDHAGVIGVARNGFGVGQVVESKMMCAP